MKISNIIMVMALSIYLVGCDGRNLENERPGIPTVGDETAMETGGAGQNAQFSNLVENVQMELNERGLNVGEVNGVMGPGTISALQAFQEQENLEVTGNINRETMEALGMDPKDWEGVQVEGLSE